MENAETENNVENELSDSQSQQSVISTFGKIFRITLLWLTFPIWSVLRAIIKTLANSSMVYMPHAYCLVWIKSKMGSCW